MILTSMGMFLSGGRMVELPMVRLCMSLLSFSSLLSINLSVGTRNTSEIFSVPSLLHRLSWIVLL